MKEEDIEDMMANLDTDDLIEDDIDERFQHLEEQISQMNENGEFDAWIAEQEAILEGPEVDEELASAIAAMEAKQQEMNKKLNAALEKMASFHEDSMIDEKLQAAIEKAASQPGPDDDNKLKAALEKRKSQRNIFESVKVYEGKRKDPKPITELSPEEAMAFLMESEQYCRTELPKYFDFSGVLAYAKEAVGARSLKECTVKGMSPADLDKVNLDIMMNKDGRYGVRPLTLANPFLYYMMVRDICSESTWKGIQECFSLFKDEHIEACAIPMVKMDDRPEAFRGSTAVLNWWNSMEQTSIVLSLKYRYMFVSDITNCFGQINPESIGWALARKGTEHETTDNDRLGKDIQEYLHAMQHGRNMGIPQGSTLFSFIAEIILGYSDMLFAKEVRAAQEKKELPAELDYHVLRYVDDYRLFCNDRDALDRLSYILQRVLERFNFRMNTSKTKITSSIISDSIKPDKLFYIFNTPIESKHTYRGEDDKPERKYAYDFDGFQKHLLYIYEFSRRFPNAGQLKNQLSAFSRRLEDFLSDTRTVETGKKGKKGGKTKEIQNHLWENKPVMIAIAAQIAEENVGSAHYALRVASQILADMKEDAMEKKRELIRLIYEKLRFQPNSAFTQVWLQNITHSSDDWIGDRTPYDMPLCRLVAGQPECLWNNSWLKKGIAAGLPIELIVDREVLEETGQVIAFREKVSYYEVGDA